MEILTTTTTTAPINHLKWDPYTANEFASVGMCVLIIHFYQLEAQYTSFSDELTILLSVV